MNPELSMLIARGHIDALVAEAKRERLAMTARRQPPSPARFPSMTRAWRRLIGWAAIELGARPAEGMSSRSSSPVSIPCDRCQVASAAK